MIIRVLWYRQFDAIIDVKLGDADADTYKYEPIKSLMARLVNINNDKQGKHCNDQRKHFSLFVLSVDVMLGREALVVLSQLILVMAEEK